MGWLGVCGFSLGINTCFAVKRWPAPTVWARLIREELELTTVQVSLDLVDLSLPAPQVLEQARQIRRACWYQAKDSRTENTTTTE